MHGDGRPVPPLLYVDDPSLLATTRAGLQCPLDRLEGYAAFWGLTVNVAKTEVVVFERQRRAAPMAARLPTAASMPFTNGGAAIDTVDEFRYLGVEFHASSAFSHAVAARAAAGALPQQQRVHATHCRCTELSLLGAGLQLHMFNAMVLPVLSCGAEIWSPQLIAAGTHCAAKRVQLSFLNQLLGVRQSMPALVLLAETG